MVDSQGKLVAPRKRRRGGGNPLAKPLHHPSPPPELIRAAARRAGWRPPGAGVSLPLSTAADSDTDDRGGKSTTAQGTKNPTGERSVPCETCPTDLDAVPLTGDGSARCLVAPWALAALKDAINIADRRAARWEGADGGIGAEDHPSAPLDPVVVSAGRIAALLRRSEAAARASVAAAVDEGGT